MLKSDRFGMEIFNLTVLITDANRLKSDRFGMEIRSGQDNHVRMEHR